MLLEDLERALDCVYTTANQTEGVKSSSVIVVGGCSAVLQNAIHPKETKDLDVLVSDVQSFESLVAVMQKSGYIIEARLSPKENDVFGLQIPIPTKRLSYCVTGEIGLPSFFTVQYRQPDVYKKIELKKSDTSPTTIYVRPLELPIEDYKRYANDETLSDEDRYIYLERIKKITTFLKR